MNRLVLGFCRRVMPPLQRVPVGGPGRPNSVVAERRPPTPASDRRGHGTGDGTPARSARRPDRPPDGADPGKHREGAVVQLSGGKPVSADPPAGRSVSGNRCPPRWSPSEGHGWSRTRTWRYARHTVTWGASGPTGHRVPGVPPGASPRPPVALCRRPPGWTPVAADRTTRRGVRRNGLPAAELHDRTLPVLPGISPVRWAVGPAGRPSRSPVPRAVTPPVGGRRRRPSLGDHGIRSPGASNGHSL